MLVGHDLEDEAENGALSIRRSSFTLAVLRIDALNWRNIQRRREEINDRIEQRLNTFILEGRTGNYRNDLHSSVPLRSASRISSSVNLFALEILVHQVVVDGRQRLRPASRVLHWPHLSGQQESRRCRTWRPLLSSFQTDAFIVDQVDNAFEVIFEHRSESASATGLAPRRVQD